MITLLFRFGGDMTMIKIDGNNITFGSVSQGAQMAPIEGLRLSRSGVEKEFPDLKDKENWNKEALKRFKEKIKSLKTERDKAQYVITDLKKHGYEPYRLQVNGRRPEKIS